MHPPCSPPHGESGSSQLVARRRSDGVASRRIDDNAGHAICARRREPDSTQPTSDEQATLPLNKIEMPRAHYRAASLLDGESGLMMTASYRRQRWQN